MAGKLISCEDCRMLIRIIDWVIETLKRLKVRLQKAHDCQHIDDAKYGLIMALGAWLLTFGFESPFLFFCRPKIPQNVFKLVQRHDQRPPYNL